MVLEDFGGDSLALLGIAGQLELSEFLKLAIAVVEILGQIHIEPEPLAAMYILSSIVATAYIARGWKSRDY